MAAQKSSSTAASDGEQMSLKQLRWERPRAGVADPFLWGLSAGGEAGVRRVIEIFRQEIDNAMALLGTPNIASITRDHVRNCSSF